MLIDDSSITQEITQSFVSQLDLKDWLVIGLGGLVILEFLNRGRKRVLETSQKKFRRAKGNVKRRKEALHTLVTGKT